MMVSSASFEAKRYGINERTVRDIWKQRTWTHATSHLAAGTGPMAKKKMGRPIGSKDSSPRKKKDTTQREQKLEDGTAVPYDPATAFPTSKFNAMPPFHTLRQNFLHNESPDDSDQVQKDSLLRRRKLDFLPLESSDEVAFHSDQSLIKDQQEVEDASINDQLHAWAHCGSRWIIDTALTLGGENDEDDDSLLVS